MAINSLKLDPESMINGIWLDLGEYGKYRVARADRQYNRRYSEISRAMLKPHSFAIENNTLSPEKEHEIFVGIYTKTPIVLEWNVELSVPITPALLEEAKPEKIIAYISPDEELPPANKGEVIVFSEAGEFQGNLVNEGDGLVCIKNANGGYTNENWYYCRSSNNDDVVLIDLPLLYNKHNQQALFTKYTELFRTIRKESGSFTNYLAEDIQKAKNG